MLVVVSSGLGKRYLRITSPFKVDLCGYALVRSHSFFTLWLLILVLGACAPARVDLLYRQ